jgi:hypothetical protein
MGRLQPVLGCIECASRVTNLIEFENGLDFLRALRRLDEDEAEGLTARKRDSGWSAISAKAAITSASAGTILGFFGADIFRVIVAHLPMSGRKTPNSTNAASGNFVLSTWGPRSETLRPFVPLLSQSGCI